ncbi:protein FAR1-RELATED SEQUENCE 5-like [Andrographis paniculata]|uniref:protein FAR1-RELATED SEQUENCE 5-like n=1 Tax=Andrographis paniculata TaxID=175694 RepID=UPI0021E98BF4|nr:protein FAR1-RELATED SEQUENCE 5-like [Andrographis paniculata]
MDSTSGSGSRDEAISVDMNVDLATTESASGGGEVDAGKVASIIRQLEARLAVGQVVADIDEAYSLYTTYALAKGFSVRKSKNRYFEKTQEVRLKMFLCNKEGEKISKPKKASRAKLETKTGCKAKLEISRERNSVWKVRQFHTEHNHELALPDEAQLLKSAREMTVGVVGVLEKMFSFGKSPSDALNDVAGEDDKTLNFKDANSLINVIKSAKINTVDCRELFQYFQSRVSSNDGFFWDGEFNELGLMKNIFWRDSRCGIDYDCFGDVVSFDATYRIEKDDLICAPFVGINHHGHNVMFGCAFLSDETVQTFEWLFGTFLRAMDNKHPQTLFTNPCKVMMTAIQNVFPNTCHRFCQWHIMKDATCQLESLIDNAEFRSLFEKCMDGCDSEVDFDGTWNGMINNYDCRDNKWLNDMYNLRQKWSTLYYGDEFNAGFRTTCRSEHGNHVLEEISNEVSSLYEFVITFEELVGRWRRKERIEDFNCKQGKLTRGLKHSPLLNHAASVYTNAVYEKFELELMSGTMANSRVSKGTYGATSWMYEVISHETDQIRTLVFDTATLEIKCSCKKFESMGILCLHALLVLTTENVHKIPERYILSRWTTNVKSRIENGDTRNVNDPDMADPNQFLRFTHDLIMRSKQHLETREILIRCLEDAASKIDNFFLRLNSETKSSKRTGMTNVSNIMEAINSETGGFDVPIEPNRVSNAVLSLCEISNKKKLQPAAESSRKSKRAATDKFQTLPQQMSLMSRACEPTAFPSETAQLLFHPIHSEMNPAASQMFYALPTGNIGMHAQGSSRDP